MISGVVNEQLEAVVSLQLRGPNGDVRMVDAIVDTGYDGYLTVAPRTVAEMGLPPCLNKSHPFGRRERH